jgi:nitrogen fixation NifU-like protein
MNAALYQQAIKDFARAGHGAGRLARADRVVSLDNPLCGDRIVLEVQLSGTTIARLGHQTRGCLLCLASASLLGLRAPGQDVAVIDAVHDALAAMLEGAAPVPDDWAELAMFLPVREHRSRHGCVLLPFRALRQGLGGQI